MLITARNLVVEANGSRLLTIASLDAECQGLMGIMGPNGSGKTTLLRCLLSLRTFSGELLIDGSEAAADKAFAYVPQQLDFPFDLLVEELVMIGRYRYHRGFPAAEDHAEVKAALAAVGILPLRGRRVHSLSGGEGQKVHIARALAQGSPGLILDEPCSHLDPGAARRLMDLLLQLASAGRKILLTLHDIELAASHLDFCVALAEGQLAFSSQGGAGLRNKLRQLFVLGSE